MGGLSGAFIPVSEDKNMIDAAASGCLTLEKLEAMTCVCSVGLDMIAIPGDTSASTISGLIADEAAIGMVNQKTTAVRVIPVAGKGVGEMANFGGLMGYAPIMPVNQTSCEAFVTRGGRIPARFTASRTDSDRVSAFKEVPPALRGELSAFREVPMYGNLEYARWNINAHTRGF